MINKNFARLKEKIKNREAVVCVLGLGYVGLPLALAFAKKGFTVIGLDTDGQKVKSLRAGRSHVEDIPDSLLRGKGGNNFRASGDFREIKKADVIHICVPTPLRKTKDPDISFILQAARQIKEHLQEGYLIVLQSTTYPGTTEEMILPLLEKGGYKAGRDFFLAFSPERVDPGNKKFGIENTPKVVGGVTPGCLRLGIMLFREICGQVISVSSF